MKNKLLKLGLALFACFAVSSNSHAQTLFAPVSPDIPWYTSACGGAPATYISGLNTAMIDFPASEGGGGDPPRGGYEGRNTYRI